MHIKRLNIYGMNNVFRRYMRQEGGIPNIPITMESIQWQGIDRNRTVVKISQITNLNTTGIEDGMEICMHDYWGPTAEAEGPAYNGEENVDPPCILIWDSKRNILKSEGPGKTEDDMYNALKRILPFRPSESITDQLKSINDRLSILEQIISDKETRQSKTGERGR
jgi:hypothetical protein